MLFYEANTEADPLVIDGDISYSRLGFVHNFLRNWLFQKLNSEEYNFTVELPLYIASQLNSEKPIWFFNNFFLVHSLRRVNVNSLFEKITLKLFKIKNPPAFDFMIDNGSGNTTPQPPQKHP